MRARTLAATLGIGLVVLWIATHRSSAPSPLVCAPGPNVIRVDTKSHRLALCEAGVARETFTVRLGRQGTGKQAEGDGKTPLGTYVLGGPRASSAYGTFVPVGYPTDAQRSQGYTGSAIGVHGPHRSMRWLGARVNAVDSTDGCIGIATDDEMNRIAEWMNEARVRTIIVE